MIDHQHTEYSHHDGLFACECGAVRIAVGEWADKKTSARLQRRARGETARLRAKHGTAVDAYGQRLSK